MRKILYLLWSVRRNFSYGFHPICQGAFVGFLISVAIGYIYQSVNPLFAGLIMTGASLIAVPLIVYSQRCRGYQRPPIFDDPFGVSVIFSIALGVGFIVVIFLLGEEIITQHPPVIPTLSSGLLSGFAVFWTSTWGYSIRES